MMKSVAFAALLLLIGPSLAQNSGTITNHAFAVGKGPGVSGFKSVGPCADGQAIIGKGSADPACGGNLKLQDGTLNVVNLYTSPPANGNFLSSAGNAFSYCSVGGCVSPLGDHQRAAALLVATTAVDGMAQENTLGIETIINTGLSTNWAISTAYATNANVRANGNVYRARSPGGTSAGAGSGPSGKTSGIADGTVVWDYINDGALDAKVGFYNAVNLKSGGGSAWAQANNLIVDSGSQKQFWVNTELNVTNNAGDCAIGSTSCYNLLLAVGGGNGAITANLAIAGKTGGSFYDAHYGILLSGDHVASDIDLAIEGSAAVGLDFGSFTTSHSIATIRDTSTSPVSYFIGGTHSTAAFQETSTSPVGLKLQGAYSTAAIDLTASFGGVAINLKDTQFICLNAGSDCFNHTSGAVQLINGGGQMFAVTDTGDLSFKQHIASAGAAPTLTGCGTSPTLGAASNDTAGTVVEGTGATGCNVHFNAPRSAAPKCLVTPNNSVVVTLVATSTTDLTWTNSTVANASFSYICMGT